MTGPDSERKLAILNEIARIALEDIELQPMLQRITDALARSFEWEFVALIRVDAERGKFVCEALSSSRDTEVHVGYSRPLGSGVVGEVAATGAALVLDDVHECRNYVETLPGAMSEICVPVKHLGQVVALLNIESTRPSAFRGQLGLLETVADQVSGAIASARLYADLELSNRRLKEANEALERLSNVDGLTSVANRRCFDEVLGREWRRAVRERTPVALLLIDVDEFKAFNDAYGHVRGDDCLRSVARVLRDSAQRAGDLVARYGGEEFAVLLSGVEGGRAAEIGELIRSRVEALEIENVRASAGNRLTVSVGVAAAVPRPRTSAWSLVAASDAALYAAKATGRNCVRISPSAGPKGVC